ncbi:MAG: 1-deoxy-D-xylulose-5-phosphate synthase N-terminal domain-containing protein, partial [Pseudomonadota bacterium]
MPISDLLTSIQTPEDVKRLSIGELNQVAIELRAFLLNTLNHTGGHLSAGLGTVELSLTLHALFDAEDRIIWDVGHQAYPHKILTGRKDFFHTLRQENGIAPFPVRKESPYDAFGVGHSSTSISAALGMSEAMKHSQRDNHA